MRDMFVQHLRAGMQAVRQLMAAIVLGRPRDSPGTRGPQGGVRAGGADAPVPSERRAWGAGAGPEHLTSCALTSPDLGQVRHGSERPFPLPAQGGLRAEHRPGLP